MNVITYSKVLIDCYCLLFCLGRILHITVFLRNLLGDNPNEKLDIKMCPDGSGQLYVPGLTEFTVKSVEDINKVRSLFSFFYIYNFKVSINLLDVFFFISLLCFAICLLSLAT